ncbi:MAG: nitronate monooxygenase [Sneathiellaceae bacterium]
MTAGNGLATALTARLGIAHPVVQAPMAGGSDTPALVAAVGAAGGIGFLGSAYRTAGQIHEAAAAVRAQTGAPFGINLFAPTPAPPAMDPTAALDRLAPYFEELGLQRPAAPSQPADGFPAQLEAALDSGAAAFSFTFGMPPADAREAIKARGMLLIGTATTVAEAVQLKEAGFEAIVAQGAEAGGHRGTFAGAFEASLVGTIALVPQVADATGLPVLASGGIMDGRGLAAALMLGAAGVQMGTAFLTTAESGVPDAYRQALLAAREDGTRLTRAFSGRPARGIVNRMMEEVAEGDILPFPLQNGLTRPLRTEAARQGRAEFLSLWAGQGVPMARPQSAVELVDRLVREAGAALGR